MYIIDYLRSPQVFSYREFQDISSVDLSSRIIRALVERNHLPESCIEQLIVGNVSGIHDGSNLARSIAINCGLTHTVGTTVNKNCSSSLEALEIARRMIDAGEADMVIAGGVEIFGRIPLTLSLALGQCFGLLMRKKMKYKIDGLRKLMTLRLKDFSLISPLQKGLIDPYACLTLGEMADQLAIEFGISKDEQDQYSLKSHQSVNFAYQNPQIVPIVTKMGVVSHDLCVRKNRSSDDFSKMPAYYPRSATQSTVSSWSASPISDGAAYLVIASEKAIKKFGLTARGKIIAGDSIAVAPERMGVSPFYSMDRLLKKNNLTPQQIDHFEINEAFAAQILANLKLIDEHWKVDITKKVNVWGGAIALGHPFGATGARLVGNLLHRLEADKTSFGLASICVAQGLGQSLLIERIAGSL